jgi:5-methylcytosine-specific restriction endonuclease McrA
MQADEKAGRGAVDFAEKVLMLLDQGSFVATYKFAVLIGLIDLCMEKTKQDGGAPEVLTTRQLAEKIVELYWPQVMLYREKTLRQNSGKQAKILNDILAFRGRLPDFSISLEKARRTDEANYKRLILDVEWTLILMPLPRLQFIGSKPVPLIYDIGWDRSIDRQKRKVREYQAGVGDRFDNRILLFPNAGNYLVMLNGLLRPLIYRQWAAMVARFNDIEESKLEEFLFGTDRIALEPVRSGLVELQETRCFYCDSIIRGTAQIDHFIPWVRYPNNAIENLVASDSRCNSKKRDFLVSGDHLRHWMARNRSNEQVLTEIAALKQWEMHPPESLSVARSIYLKLPGGVPLWVAGDSFTPAEPDELQKVLA